MKRLRKDKAGSISILAIGLIFLLLLFTFLVAEMGATYENYAHCMDVLQRCCNSAVEANIDDSYRADRILKLKTEAAKEDFARFLSSDLSDRYAVTIDVIECTETPPTMTVVGSVTFDTLFAQYDWDDVCYGFKIHCTDYDLDG